jgi:hypothetical protein
VGEKHKSSTLTWFVFDVDFHSLKLIRRLSETDNKYDIQLVDLKNWANPSGSLFLNSDGKFFLKKREGVRIIRENNSPEFREYDKFLYFSSRGYYRWINSIEYLDPEYP